MEYKLTLAQTMDAISSIGNPLILLFAALVQVVILSMILYSFLYLFMRNHRKVRKIVLSIALIFFFGSTVGLMVWPIWGSGWQIKGDTMSVKTYFHSDDIKISSMDIGFVKAESKQWQPVIRIAGAGLPNLLVGKCLLANKQEALVFYYQNTEEMLLISANNNYYLIGHPGAASLYNDLIRLGAKNKKFAP